MEKQHAATVEKKKKKKHLASKKNVDTAPASVISAKRKWRPGTVANREIRKFQKTTCNLIGTLPFRRLVRELAAQISDTKKFRFTATALEILQEAAEGYIVTLLNDTGLLAMFKRHKSISPYDIMMALRIRGEKR